VAVHIRSGRAVWSKNERKMRTLRSDLDFKDYQSLLSKNESVSPRRTWTEYFTELLDPIITSLIPYRIPIMIFLSIFCGVIFYHWVNSWPISTALFYSVNTLLGELFMVPGNKSPVADVFTVFYYIYGAFFLAGILGQYVGVLVSHAPEIAATERKKLMECPESPIDTDEDGVVGLWDHIEFHKLRLMQRVGWETNKWKYITFAFVVLWIGVGVVYGVVMEEKEFGSALFFAVSTIAGACYVGTLNNPPPPPSNYLSGQGLNVTVATTPTVILE
jgi:hypothetical protein